MRPTIILRAFFEFPREIEVPGLDAAPPLAPAPCTDSQVVADAYAALMHGKPLHTCDPFSAQDADFARASCGLWQDAMHELDATSKPP